MRFSQMPHVANCVKKVFVFAKAPLQSRACTYNLRKL